MDDDTREQGRRLATRAVQAGAPDPVTGAHVTPIYQTSTFAYGSFARGARLFAGDEEGYVYGRIANPTTRAFEEVVASLEGAEDALAFSSGIASISALCLTTLRPGDELVFLGPLYGGTEGFFLEVLASFGVGIRQAEDEAELEALVGPATKMVYLETPTNPTLRIRDLARVARAAREAGALSVVDNTFATPALTRPREHGIDVSLHSATKYLGGHGDALGGVLTGSGELLAAVRAEGLRHVGGALGPFESYLFLRGVKTLPLRMERHSANAQRVAEALVDHPGVVRVHYPGLPEHPGHEIARRQMDRFGGMVSLDLEGGRAAAERFLDALQLFTQAVSLGDVQSLASHPASTTHQLLPPELLDSHGITPGLVRLSVGLEDPEDLLEDLRQALAAAVPARA